MTAPRIARIDQSKLRENAYFALRDAFTRGEFAPGDIVSLRVLADQLGTSMTPVREAVRRLVAEGALVDTPSRTLMVPPFDGRRMEDLKAARLALEALVLDQAMARMTDACLDGMEAILATEPRGGDAMPDLQQNYDFHFALYRQSGSEVLLPLVEALWLQYGAYLNLIIHHRDATRIDQHKHHHEIIAALRRGDGAAAHRALAADVERSFQVIAADQKDRTRA
ncbi:GntR family transcriptional regulator [Albidovulum sediminis]|uniref:GntR family transcriptional regulator n=1 Tax=Albidovulum sediminis TaxID=3066345 RepID=A0ABT2NGU9_9RHOB|nr:GntR family transcriptional regulator [Defluviimonas sediminis]MCT8328134.1 GntR family transcriptional regulator [Defluviimonas sediminis]